MDKNVRITLIDGIQRTVGCPVIKANQSKPKIPKYPYISFTITTPFMTNGGTWGEYEDGMKRKPFKQVWSFTVQSDDDNEALELAMKLYEYFDCQNSELDEMEISVVRVSDINNRDNFITIQYEHRYGFDVTFSIMRDSTGIIKEPELVPIEIYYKKGERR